MLSRGRTAAEDADPVQRIPSWAQAGCEPQEGHASHLACQGAEREDAGQRGGTRVAVMSIGNSR